MSPLRQGAVLVLSVLLLGSGDPGASRAVREAAYRDNNHGVALLEQFRPLEAAAAFRLALAKDPDLSIAKINLAIALLNVPDLPEAEVAARGAVAARPDSPQAHYVLGLVTRGQNNAADAIAAFRRVLELDPSDVGSNVNLGQLYLQDRKYDAAIAAFRAALAVESYSATAVYNLGLALSRAGQADEGLKAMERFRELRDAGYGTLIGQTYPEQGRHAEAIASTGAEGDLVDATTPGVRFEEEAARTFTPTPPLARGPAAGASDAGRVTLFDLDQDGGLDVFDVGAAGQRLYRNDGGRFVDVTARLGLDPSQAGVGAIAGDLDNDTRSDLLVLRKTGVTLYHNVPDKGFVDITAAAGLQAARPALTAALADFDHDGDLDILLGGAGTPERLFQNSGDATFKDVASASFAGIPSVLAVVPTDYDNGRDMDLLEIAAGAPPRLLRNLRDGTFRDVAAEVGLGHAERLRSLAVADVNKDTYSDVFLGSDASDLLALSDGTGRFRLAPVPWNSSGTTAAQFIDYDNDGLLDLVTFAPSGARLLRNLGSRWVDVSDAALGDTRRSAVSAIAAGDLDGDGDTDLLVRLGSGELRLWRNDGGNRNRSIRVGLAGLVSNRSGLGAKIELRAGSLSQKLETSATTPSAAPADVLFGLGARETVDAVRVIWPAGVLQTELDPAVPAAGTRTAAAFEIKELNRKPSSCPYLYAWNGSAFSFVTDFMGGGEMGYFEAPGVWNEPDPVEYVRLTDEQLRPRDGRYEVRVTNELEEALFVDRIALVSVAHPRDVEIYPYEGMTSPPKPVRFFAVRNARPPASAVDDHGHDVLERVAELDRRFPDDFGLYPIRGYAAGHALTLDLGRAADRSVLLLTGWTDYAWSSDNVAAGQAGLAMRPPSLEVRDADGRWVTAVEQVGVPVGRPQTVVVDLTGAWKGASRQVRIVTNMRIYWDQVRVADAVEMPGEPVSLDPIEARLAERGFSAEIAPDGREPFVYDYSRVSQASPWKAIPGRYTREGDVRELLSATDDAFVTSRPGDEIALAFDAAALTALPAGWRRTFLLLSDGFSKEMDIHSATPDALGPLPFHGMSHYPYAAPERHPMTPARAQMLERYNTRVVKAAVPALDVAVSTAGADAGAGNR